MIKFFLVGSVTCLILNPYFWTYGSGEHSGQKKKDYKNSSSSKDRPKEGCKMVAKLGKLGYRNYFLNFQSLF
jgi:hypothetical protein